MTTDVIARSGASCRGSRDESPPHRPTDREDARMRIGINVPWPYMNGKLVDGR